MQRTRWTASESSGCVSMNCVVRRAASVCRGRGRCCSLSCSDRTPSQISFQLEVMLEKHAISTEVSLKTCPHWQCWTVTPRWSAASSGCISMPRTLLQWAGSDFISSYAGDACHLSVTWRHVLTGSASHLAAMICVVRLRQNAADSDVTVSAVTVQVFLVNDT